MNWIIGPLRQYGVFTGRAQRREFFIFLAFVTLVTLVAHVFDARDGDVVRVAAGMGIAELCVTLVFLLPSVALGVRRLHDSGRSGMWMLLGYGPLALVNLQTQVDPALMPIIIGALIMGGGAWLVMMLLPGDRGTNRYGTDPRGR